MAFEFDFSPTPVVARKDSSSASRRGTHQLLQAASCERAYGFKHVWHLSPAIEPPWRLVGSLIHELLAFHYAARCATPPAFYVGKEHWTQREQLAAIGGEAQPAQMQTALDFYRYYVQQTVGEAMVPLYVEQEFTASIGELDPGGPFPELDGEVVSCRSDLVASINGDVVIVDHKCLAGEWKVDRLPALPPQNDYTRSLQLRVNMLLVGAHQRRLGLPEPAGFMIQRLKRKLPFDMARDDIEIPPGAMAEAVRTLRLLVRRELAVRAQFDLDPWSVLPNDSQCTTKFGPCEYAGICNARPDEREQLIQLEYVSVSKS